MKFGISYNTGYYGTDPGAIADFARHAEQCGFEAFYVPEHIVLYPGATFGGMPFPSSLAIADPLELLTFVAARTERILLGTAVLLLPYRHPVVLAKQLATIDVLSRGRMRLLTVGLGSLPGEAAAVAVDYASRGRRADEAIDVLRLLWAGDENGASFDGEFFSFTDVCIFPKPWAGSSWGVQTSPQDPPRATLPIHVGGSSRGAALRAGRRGDGYFPGGRLTPAERAGQLDLMRGAAVAAGRDPDALEYTRWGSIDMSPADVEARAREGITRLVIGASSADPADQRAELSAFVTRMGSLFS